MTLHHRTKRRAVLAAVVPAAALAAAVLPSAAQAGSLVTSSDGILGYVDPAGRESNRVVLRMASGDRILVSDPAGISIATTRCRVVTATEASCASDVPSVDVQTTGGSDSVEYRLPHGGTVDLGTDNDTAVAGVREAFGRVIQPVNLFGGPGDDLVGYGRASSGVSVDMADGIAADGRAGDRENVLGFEHLHGSAHRDILFGTPGRDGIAGGGERDVIAGGHGDDFFYTGEKDGADDYHGGPGSDWILYIGRTQPLSVQLDNIAADGEAGEGDNVRSNVENVFGGSADDTLTSFGAFSRLEGGAGNDVLSGGAGPDTIIGGPGLDSIDAGTENDVVDAGDGDPDAVDCGTGFDGLTRDVGEGRITGCESVQVGVLRLASKALSAKAGAAARVDLSWRHPQGWRKLRSVTLRLTDDGVPVGAVTVTPRDGKVTADGAVEVARSATTLTRRGKAVQARLGLKVDPSVAGRKLGLEVEATDTRGRRQLERDAGTLRVAR
jgi:hypothetical protein